MDWSNNGASAPGPSLSGTSRPELLSAKKVEFKLASLTGFCRNSYASWLFPFPASRRTENRVDDFHVGERIFKRNGNFRVFTDGARERIALNGVLIAGRNFFDLELSTINPHSIGDRDLRRPAIRCVKRNFDGQPPCRCFLEFPCAESNSSACHK